MMGQIRQTLNGELKLKLVDLIRSKAKYGKMLVHDEDIVSEFKKMCGLELRIGQVAKWRTISGIKPLRSNQTTDESSDIMSMLKDIKKMLKVVVDEIHERRADEEPVAR